MDAIVDRYFRGLSWSEMVTPERTQRCKTGCKAWVGGVALSVWVCCVLKPKFIMRNYGYQSKFICMRNNKYRKNCKQKKRRLGKVGAI
jgi:hypothetical protein